jgi:hypothetical protein
MPRTEMMKEKGLTLVAAINEALRQAKDETKRNMGDLASGLPIPPGLLPPGLLPPGLLPEDMPA